MTVNGDQLVGVVIYRRIELGPLARPQKVAFSGKISDLSVKRKIKKTFSVPVWPRNSPFLRKMTFQKLEFFKKNFLKHVGNEK